MAASTEELAIEKTDFFTWIRERIANLRKSKIFKRKIIIGGLMIIVLFILVAIFGPMVSPMSYREMDIAHRLSPPSLNHLFGTDKVGRDILSRVIMGARYTMLVGMSVMVSTMIIGSLLGMISGFVRRIDNIVMRILDGMMAFPPILLAIAMMAALGASVANVIMALSIVYMPRIARIVRSQVLSARELVYVEAATALGIKPRRIIFRHILPNVVSPVIVQGTFVFAYAVLNEAALSFLGVGVPPMIPTWGNMLSEGRDVYQVAYWYMLFPGAFIVLVVFAINMVGDGLRDIFDPLTFSNK